MTATAQRLSVAFTCVFLAWYVSGDEVIINNGDRLTGTIITTEKGKLIIETSYAGEVKVQLSDIQTIVTDKSVQLVLEDDTQVSGILSTVDGTGMAIQGDIDSEFQTLSMNQISAINPPETPAVQISGQFNAGIERNRGNTDNDKYHLDAKTRFRWFNSRLNINTDGDLERTNNKKSKQKGELGIKYDYFFDNEDYLFHQKWYLWSGVGFEHDKFADLNLRTTTGLGPGYQILETERTHLSVEAGASYIWENFDASEGQDYAAARWALDFKHQLFNLWKLEAFHNHHLRWSVEDTDRYVFNSETGLRIPIIDRMQATVQFNFDRNNSPAQDAKKNDYDTLITGGYAW